ncbi:MAG TPA: hypothetical protein PKL15_10530 [Saprospiraceae bacterium]|nr:hypothetical protein [Saprospiraceae bacterium]HNM25859.1 hypothetical protein [Saprospiraceae bacterium]
MQNAFSILVRAAFTFVAFVIIQYVIPYYFLVAGGLLGGLFMWRSGSDRQLGIGMLLGTVAFGVFAWLYGNV